MASFTVRIELHDASLDHYQELYDAMDRLGFTDVITSDEDVTYKMPPGEYNFFGTFPRQSVLEMAKNAAKETGKKHSVLVTESAGRSWSNLSKP